MWKHWVALRSQLDGQLWLRPALASLGSALLVGLALRLGALYRGPLPLDISAEALIGLLSIMASSMLAVATFSVSAVVTAVTSISNATTPRAARLILSDTTTQNVLASFIAAFIYSMIAILALEAFVFDRAGRFIVFVGLAVIVAWVLVALVRWIDHVTRLGRLETGIEKMVAAALRAVTPDNAAAWGARVYDGGPPVASAVVAADKVGMVTQIHAGGLQELAARLDAYVYLTVRPGDFVDTRTPIAYLTPVSDALREAAHEVQSCVVIASSRSFAQDIRFGLVTLAETADRALSPGINDPGTAIVILGRELEVLTRWAETVRSQPVCKTTFDRVLVPPLKAAELVRDAFTAIARDGAGAVEVAIRLQKTFAALVRLDHAELTAAAVAMSQEALDQAERALVAEQHKERVRAARREVLRLAGAQSDAERNRSTEDGVNF